jgi:hypothetical protein
MHAYRSILITAALGCLAGSASSEPLTPERKAKVEARVKTLQSWSTDPAIVSAVQAYNANPPAEAKAMTNEKWKSLTVLDPLVRSFTRNALGQHLKGKQTPEISECFVSGADGSKAAFLSKTSSWSHGDKDKHRVPMTGKPWIGPAEVDESTGQLQVQVGLPVLDKGKPIGSIVIGLKVSAL